MAINKNKGFTLIELIMFVIVLGIVATIISGTIALAFRYTPLAHKQTIAAVTADKCMEYFLGQRYLEDKGFNSITCPASYSPAFCNATSSSIFTTSVDISCTVFNGDTHFKLIKVETTENNGPGKAILKLLIADY